MISVFPGYKLVCPCAVGAPEPRSPGRPRSASVSRREQEIHRLQLLYQQGQMTRLKLAEYSHHFLPHPADFSMACQPSYDHGLGGISYGLPRASFLQESR